MAIFGNNNKKQKKENLYAVILDDVSSSLEPKKAELAEKINKLVIKEFYDRYPQYNDYEIDLDIRDINNLKKFHDKYENYSKEVIPSYCLKLNIEKSADEFFTKHPQYKDNFAIGDLFLANRFFALYPNLDDKEHMWTMPEMESFLKEEPQMQKEIDNFYKENKEYIGEFLTKEERDEVIHFYEDFPATKGVKWSIEAIDKFYTIDSLERENINNFYKEYPEYRGDYMQKGRILVPYEIKDLTDFHEEYIDKSLRGVKWDVEVAAGFKVISQEERKKRLDFYRKYPDFKGEYVTNEKIYYVKNLPESKLSYKLEQKQEELKKFFKEKVNELFGKIKLKVISKGKVFKKMSVSLHKGIKSKFKAGLLLLSSEYDRIIRYKKIRHEKILDNFIKNEGPEYGNDNLTYKDYKKIRDFYKDYPYYQEAKLNPKDIKTYREFFENNPEYKNTAIRVQDLPKANEFCKTYPELLKGKKWDINDMYKLLEEGQIKENQNEIKRFYRKNPEYRGMYLDKKDMEKVETFFKEFSDLKCDRPWDIETIDRITNDVKKFEKSYVNDFYRNYPQYKGKYTNLDEMDIMNKFFKENPSQSEKNWEIEAIQEYNNADDKQKERIMRIYEYNPEFAGVYLSEAKKMYLEKNVPEEEKNIERNIGKIDIKKREDKSITKDRT